jgi:glycerate dehydrogenase
VVLDESLIQSADSLKLICVAATGMNNIDRKAAARAGVEVKNVSGYASASVAQTTFAMLFSLMQPISYYNNFVKSGDYSKHPIFTNMEVDYHELGSMRFGIIGLGDIGSRVAQIAEAFGAEVVYHSTSGRNLDQPYTHLKLNELLKTSDVVSIHAPLNEHTDGLIGLRELKLMKRSAYLLNTGRGGIVIEKDLAKALDEELIAGAGLDVFEEVPMNPENPLLSVQNKDRLVMTPHVAWASVEARTELINGVIENIREFQKQAG